MTYARALTRPLLAMVLATLAATCGGDVADTVAKDVLVDTEWVEAHMNDADVRLVDVGGGVEGFLEGHIPGASFLAMSLLSNPGDPISGQIATEEGVSAALSSLGIKRDQTVVLYDDRNNLPSARAYWVLKYYQHAQVRIYNGGEPRWVADGRALSTEAPESEASSYQAGPADPAIRTTWQYVMDHTDDPSTLFCDARGPEEHLGRSVRAARGGHIPGSINVEWTAAVAPDGTFKSADALAELYSAAGFAPDKDIITYCQSGIRGAHTWFVLSELLGYPSVRNYDGSWAEYGNNPESTIES
jgi:thiosulfate/3-mercaptopyruvate sulfurtransferase